MRNATLTALAVVLAAGLAAAPAAAADNVVYNTALKDVNFSESRTVIVGGSPQTGTVTATTTEDATGTRTTVTGPNAAGFRYVDNAPSMDVWQQQFVGAGGTVGITTDFARDGNGSAFFSGVNGSSKADLEFYFSQPVALSSLTAMSYDVYRDASSTANAHLVNSLRLLIGDANGAYTGAYLIFEPVYNGFPTNAPIAEDTWYNFQIGAASRLWSNSTVLTEPAGTGTCPSCFGTLAAWQAANANATIVGLSTGAGSGFNGVYKGAVDNISFTAGGVTTSYNFEVAVVPEPATWGLMIAGFAGVGAALRRRRRVAFAA